jgi:tripartite-type tricarboxylate transporter receptor subunit TctC
MFSKPLIGAIFAALSLPLAAAAAESYPQRPIRMIVPFAAGGAADIIARVMGTKLGETLGQPIVVDLRPGAGSTLGTDIAAKATPDGYTLALVATAHALNPGLRGKLPYDPIRDFAPITLAVESPLIFLTPPSTGINSIGELIALAKSQPKRVIYGSSGQGTSGHLATELLQLRAGISMTHVPYKGAGQALNDLLGGQIQLLCTSTLPSLPHVRSGKLKVLAVTTLKRSRAAPDVPTVAEAGLPGFNATTWYALLAPAGTSPAIVGKVHGAAVQALHSPQVVQQLSAQGAEAIANRPEELRAFLEEQIATWTKVMRQANIHASN